MLKYNKPQLREKLSEKSEKLVSDLIQSIVGQIRIFEGKKNENPCAIYGISRCLRMLHEHFEADFTKEAKNYLDDLQHPDELANKDRLTIREVYNLSRKIDKSNRKLYVEHTDGGIKELAISLLKYYGELKGNKEDINKVKEFIQNNTYFIIKHKELNKDINERFSIKDL